MKKVLTAAAIIAMATAFTACGDDSSSASGPSCEVKDTATGIKVIESIPELGEYTTEYKKNDDGTYGDSFGFTSMSYEEAKASAQRDCDNFLGAE